METIVRENKPVELQGVVKSRVDDSKWEGLESLDVGSKFLMFEKGGSQDRESRVTSDRYTIFILILVFYHIPELLSPPQHLIPELLILAIWDS
jgi:hypothetical protein